MYCWNFFIESFWLCCNTFKSFFFSQHFFIIILFFIISFQGLKSCDLQGTKWLSIIENAIVEGYPVLLQCINAQLDSTLEPLFTKTNKVIIFNNKELKLHKSFHLYILSKSSNLEFSPVLIKKMCIVNFTIKEKGMLFFYLSQFMHCIA